MDAQPITHVSFLIPIMNDKIYLGQRATPPWKGYYGPIGGKSGSAMTDHLPYTKYALGGHKIPIINDQLSMLEGREFGHVAALREFYEETFQRLPHSFNLPGIVYLGSVSDEYSDKPQSCSFYFSLIPKRKWNINPHELSDISPVTEIPHELIFPLGQLALEGMRVLLSEPMIACFDRVHLYRGRQLDKQIPQFDHTRLRSFIANKPTSIMGALILLAGDY